MVIANIILCQSCFSFSRSFYHSLFEIRFTSSFQTCVSNWLNVQAFETEHLNLAIITESLVNTEGSSTVYFLVHLNDIGSILLHGFLRRALCSTEFPKFVQECVLALWSQFKTGEVHFTTFTSRFILFAVIISCAFYLACLRKRYLIFRYYISPWSKGDFFRLFFAASFW